MLPKELFQFSLNNTSEIVMIFNAEGVIIYANEAAERELEYKNQVCGHSITDIFPEQFEPAENSLVIRCKAFVEPQNAMAYRGNRTCFPVKIRLFRYDGASEAGASSEKGPLYLCTAYDTSLEVFFEKKASQAGVEAEKAEKVKSEFVANVTHELRTPVNGILGNAQELIRRESDSAKLQLLGLIERGCKDMNELINSILDFSKLEAGKFVLEPREFNFGTMIEYVKGNHSNRIVEKGLDFAISVSPDIPECIIGDELRIVQVLNNLISNAYKFTSVGGIQVEVIKSMQSGNSMKLFFMVIDTGIGIEKQNQDKLFQSFTQVDASITRKYGGTGLGLSICKQLVELMGGNIYVESEYGKGSIFSFDIWVNLPENYTGGKGEQEETVAYGGGDNSLLDKLYSLTDEKNNERTREYGTQENTEEIRKKLNKLILCIEMGNWEKAEMFADTVKQLLEGAPREVGKIALRMKMAVQKSDYEKAVEACETLSKMLFDSNTEEPDDRSE